MIFSRISKGRSIFVKMVSLFVIQSFILSNIAFAAPENKPVTSTTQSEITTDPNKIVIPTDSGLIKSKFTGKSDRIIIHIQDAHCNYEAQTNISKILENLIKNYGLSLVSVEGADGFIDTSWFKAFPDDDVRKEVATYFMKKGEITGPEFLSITTDYPIKLFGAETRSYYIQNLNAFTSSYPYKEAIEKYLNEIKTVLNKLKAYIYTEDLKTMDSKKQNYDSKKMQFNDYVRFLESMAEKQRINIRQYDNLFKLISVLIYEKKIDFTVTDKERNTLIDELSKAISKEKLNELVAKSLAFKVGKTTSVEYYDWLKNLAKENNIEIVKAFPNLTNYIIYNSVYSRIENEKLFNDIKSLETAIKEKLFKNEDQRTLDKLSYHIDILIGLVNIKLLNGDFVYYQAHKAEFTHEAFTGFIKAKATQYGLVCEIGEPHDAVVSSIPKLEDFYSIAIKRDKALVDNTIDAMKKEKAKIAVLVTGGFHSEGISKLLEKQGVSYMVVCPSITKDAPSPYIQILTNQRTSFEEILMDTGAGAGAAKAEAKHGMLAPQVIAQAVPMYFRNSKALDALLMKRVDRVVKAWVRRYVREWYARVNKAGLPKGYGSLIKDEKVMFDAFEIALKKRLKKLSDKGIVSDEKWTADIILKLVEPVLSETVSGAETLRGPQMAVPARASASGVTNNQQSRIVRHTRVLSPAEAVQFDEILRQSFAFGLAHVIAVPGIRKGFQFVIHDRFVESLEEKNLPFNLHPGRGGSLTNHQLLQVHLDTYIYKNLTKGERELIAHHELAHLDIFNLERMTAAERAAQRRENPIGYATWDEWAQAGRPIGQDQEGFINTRLSGIIRTRLDQEIACDTRPVERKVAKLAIKKLEEAAVKEEALRVKLENLHKLRGDVLDHGVAEVLAITEGGDAAIVANTLTNLRNKIFRRDGKVKVKAHEERTRRGQLLGLLDAMDSYGAFDRDRVSLGIMMPGKGKRLSPITERLFGIKPFMEMLIRPDTESDWLSGATSSLYTWNLVCYHLERMGFRGIAWKWGDEPQIAATHLNDLALDLSQTDIIRFGSRMVVTPDLAENKEWLSADSKGNLIAQVRRRARPDLLRRLGFAEDAIANLETMALIHIGSPAFSYVLIDEAKEVFKDLPRDRWLDVDGYFIEGLTLDKKTWDEEYQAEIVAAVRRVITEFYELGEGINELVVAEKIRCSQEEVRTALNRLTPSPLVELEFGRYVATGGTYNPETSREAREEKKFSEPGMRSLLKMCPDFYERCQELKRRVNLRRGRAENAPLDIKVIDFGEDLYWGDIGQLSKARQVIHLINEDTPEGKFARELAGIEEGDKLFYVRDEYDNIIVGECIYPQDGSVRNSVLINTNIYGEADVANAVLVKSELGDAYVKPGSVVWESTVLSLQMGENAFSYKSVTEVLNILSNYVHTSIPKNLANIADGLDDWYADTEPDEHVDAKEIYEMPQLGNPSSYNELHERMVQRDIPPSEIESAIRRGRTSRLISRLRKAYELVKRFVEPRDKRVLFGTSGLRAPDENLTDMETYINTEGFIEYLISLGSDNDGIKRGDIIDVAADFRPSSKVDRIPRAIAAAIKDSGCLINYCGNLPTGAVTNYGMRNGRASLMVTGSHNPYGQNGIKFNKPNGEILKPEEKPILAHVAKIRKMVYRQDAAESLFDMNGSFKTQSALSTAQREMLRYADERLAKTNIDEKARTEYIERFDVFGKFGGERVVVYWDQTTVGQEVQPEILERAGFKVVHAYELDEKYRMNSGDDFLAVDTEKPDKPIPQFENKTLKGVLRDIATKAKAKEEYGESVFAVITSDGDADRPVFSGENGEFLMGDKLGVLVSMFLRPDFVSVPATCNSAAVEMLTQMGIIVQNETQVGSPYIIAEMNNYMEQVPNGKAAGYEANGGYLTGSDWIINGRTLPKLPTRDAMFPILCALKLAIDGAEDKVPPASKVSDLSKLFTRDTAPDSLDDKTPGFKGYTPEEGGQILASFSPADAGIYKVDFQTRTMLYKGPITYTAGAMYRNAKPDVSVDTYMLEAKANLEKFFTKERGFGAISRITYTDGVRIFFENGDIVHFRRSGNEAIFRFYPEASTIERATAMMEMCLIIMPEILKALRSDALERELPELPETDRHTPGIYTAVALEEVPALPRASATGAVQGNVVTEELVVWEGRRYYLGGTAIDMVRASGQEDFEVVGRPKQRYDKTGAQSALLSLENYAAYVERSGEEIRLKLTELPKAAITERRDALKQSRRKKEKERALPTSPDIITVDTVRYYTGVTASDLVSVSPQTYFRHLQGLEEKVPEKAESRVLVNSRISGRGGYGITLDEKNRDLVIVDLPGEARRQPSGRASASGTRTFNSEEFANSIVTTYPLIPEDIEKNPTAQEKLKSYIRAELLMNFGITEEQVVNTAYKRALALVAERRLASRVPAQEARAKFLATQGIAGVGVGKTTGTLVFPAGWEYTDRGQHDSTYMIGRGLVAQPLIALPRVLALHQYEAAYTMNHFMLAGLPMMHDTYFPQAAPFFPGATQYQVTGAHYQGAEFDVKYVTAGKGKQYLIKFNRQGQVEKVIVQEMAPGKWVYALPGYIDIVVNEGGLAFSDIPAYKLSKEKAAALGIEATPEDMETAKKFYEALPAKGMAHVFYAFNGQTHIALNPEARFNEAAKNSLRPMFVEMGNPVVGGRKVTSSLLTVYRENPELLKGLISPEFMRGIYKSLSTGQEAKSIGYAVPESAAELETNAEKVRETFELLEKAILEGRPVSQSPFIMTGKEGYTWGQKVRESYILELMGAKTPEEKEALAVKYGISNDTAIAELWVGAGAIDMGTGCQLPVETLSLFGTSSGLTQKVLTSAVPLSVQTHSFNEMIIPLANGYAYMGTTKEMTPEEFIAAMKNGEAMSVLKRVELKKGVPVIVPANLPHAYGEVIGYEVKAVTPDQDRRGTRSIYDRLRWESLAAGQKEEAERLFEQFRESKTPAEAQAAVGQLVEKKLIRVGKDVLTIPEEEVMETVRRIDQAGYLKEIDISKLQFEPVLASAPETQEEARFEIMGAAEGFKAGRYIIQAGRSIEAYKPMQGKTHYLFVTEGEIAIKKNGVTIDVVGGKGKKETPIFDTTGEYTIEALEGPAVVYTQYKPLKEAAGVRKSASGRTLVEFPNPAELPPEKRVVALISGGESAGVNDYFARLARKLATQGYSLELIRFGLNGLVKPAEEFVKNRVWVNEGKARAILGMPGAAEGTARVKLNEENMPNVIANLKGYCKTLVMVGGNDHLGEASKIAKRFASEPEMQDMVVVALPKTVDRDTMVYPIGAITAGEEANNLIRRGAALPGSNKCMIFQIMGRDMGYLTVAAAEGLGPTAVVLTPEWSVKPTGEVIVSLSDIVTAVKARMAKYGAANVVVSEGFRITKNDALLNKVLERNALLAARYANVKYDTQGNPQLGELGIADFIAEAIDIEIDEVALGENILVEVPGYSYRSTTPNAIEQAIAESATEHAARLITTKEGREEVVLKGGVCVAAGRNLEKGPVTNVMRLTEATGKVDLADSGFWTLKELKAKYVLGLAGPEENLMDLPTAAYNVKRPEGANLELAVNAINSQTESSRDMGRPNVCVIARPDADEIIETLGSRSPVSLLDEYVMGMTKGGAVYFSSKEPAELSAVLDLISWQFSKAKLLNLVVSGNLPINPKDKIFSKIKENPVGAALLKSAKKDNNGNLIFGRNLADLLVLAMTIEKNMSGVRKNVLGETLNLLPGEEAKKTLPVYAARASASGEREKAIEKWTAELIGEYSTTPDRDSLRDYLRTLLMSGTLDNKAVIVAYDTGLESEIQTGKVAQQGEQSLNKPRYLNNRLVNVRGTGQKLVDGIRKAIAELEGEGIPYALVTIAGNKTMSEVSGDLEKLKGNKILNIQNPDGRYIPIIGLYELALRMAYDIGEDRILECLNRIAANPDNPNNIFTKDDLGRVVIRLLPRIGPVDTEEARKAYEAAKKVLESL